jgi:hypothetical protein
MDQRRLVNVGEVIGPYFLKGLYADGVVHVLQVFIDKDNRFFSLQAKYLKLFRP